MNINKFLRDNPVNSSRGAPMGSRNVFEGGKVYVQRLQMVDGDYGPDGTYWGAGRLYVGMSEEGTLIYVRAKNRAAALTAFREKFADIVFARA